MWFVVWVIEGYCVNNNLLPLTVDIHTFNCLLVFI